MGDGRWEAGVIALDRILAAGLGVTVRWSVLRGKGFTGRSVLTET